jgi:hypothetical protein
MILGSDEWLLFLRLPDYATQKGHRGSWRLSNFLYPLRTMAPILPVLLAQLCDLLGICSAVGIDISDMILFRIVSQILALSLP